MQNQLSSKEDNSEGEEDEWYEEEEATEAEILWEAVRSYGATGLISEAIKQLSKLKGARRGRKSVVSLLRRFYQLGANTVKKLDEEAGADGAMVEIYERGPDKKHAGLSAAWKGSKLLNRSPESARLRLDPHLSRLFFFGQRFRDRLSLDISHDSAEVIEGDPQGIWNGSPTDLWINDPRDADDAKVEEEWGFGHYDALTHSLFPLFKEHLQGHQCWQLLEDAERVIDLARQGSTAPTLREAVENFQMTLSPDDLLEKLLLQSRCYLCP